MKRGLRCHPKTTTTGGRPKAPEGIFGRFEAGFSNNRESPTPVRLTENNTTAPVFVHTIWVARTGVRAQRTGGVPCVPSAHQKPGTVPHPSRFPAKPPRKPRSSESRAHPDPTFGSGPSAGAARSTQAESARAFDRSVARRTSGWIAQSSSTISKDFTPRGAFTLITSPTRDFINASPIGLFVVTST